MSRSLLEPGLERRNPGSFARPCSSSPTPCLLPPVSAFTGAVGTAGGEGGVGRDRVIEELLKDTCFFIGCICCYDFEAFYWLESRFWGLHFGCSLAVNFAKMKHQTSCLGWFLKAFFSCGFGWMLQWLKFLQSKITQWDKACSRKVLCAPLTQ